MKKIITINLSGRILSIEELAFEQLQSYIASLRDFFAAEDSREEIINDMQGRIAELMHDKINNGSVCITELDVQELIAQMGRPEELAQESVAESATNDTSPTSNTGSKNYAGHTGNAHHRKLYRDEANKIIGGVAGGLAAYLGVDPAIVRALLVILAFSSFGLALFGYVLLWIFLPASTVESFKGKRFYRDPDNKIFGGVAGGFAAYFDKPVRTIRLLFLSPLLLTILFSILDWTDDDLTFVLFNLSFGSLIGFSIIMYITLWIILPKAITPYQKMEMRGEKIDLASIQKQVTQGAEKLAGEVNQKVTAWSKEIETVANELPGKAEKLAGEVNQRIQQKFTGKERTIAGRIFRLIGLLIKVFFAFIFGVLAFSLMMALLAICFAGAITWPYQSFVWDNNAQQLLAWAAVLFFGIVPLLGVIIWLIRRVVGIKKKSRVLRYGFFSLWTLGWVLLFLFISSIGKDFAVREQRVNSVVLPVIDPSTLRLTVSQPTLVYSDRVPWIDIQGEEKGWDLSKDTLKLSAIVIETVESPDSDYHIEIIRSANGKNAKQAARRAEALSYPINANGYFVTGANKADSGIIVDLPSYYAIAANDKYRAQQIKLVVQIPVGKTISFDESIKEKLTIGELHIRYNKRGRIKEIYWDDADLRYQSDVLYKMMPGGGLRPVDDTVLSDGPPAPPAAL